MTINNMEHEDVKTRIRKRRRRLLTAKRKGVSMKMRRATIIGIVCMSLMMGGSYAVYGNDAKNGEPSYTVQSETYTVQSGHEAEYISVIVRSGDTLWGIASTYLDTSKDIRELVREIRILNGIDPGSIYPGQIIKVPVLGNNA